MVTVQKAETQGGEEDDWGADEGTSKDVKKQEDGEQTGRQEEPTPTPRLPVSQTHSAQCQRPPGISLNASQASHPDLAPRAPDHGSGAFHLQPSLKLSRCCVELI